MIGFACTETREYVPPSISLAHKLRRRLAEVRKDGTLPYLRPDGKSQGTVEHSYGKPVRMDKVLVFAQHDPDVTHGHAEADVIEHVIKDVVLADLLDDSTRYLLNLPRRFVTGGLRGPNQTQAGDAQAARSAAIRRPRNEGSASCVTRDSLLRSGIRFSHPVECARLTGHWLRDILCMVE